MTTTTTSRNKHKNHRQKTSNDIETYKPGLTKEEKAKRHRKAVSLHYTTHPEVRERRRLQAVQRRTDAKLKKRRWDPPRERRRKPSSHMDDVGSIGSIAAGASVLNQNDFEGSIIPPPLTSCSADFERVPSGGGSRTSAEQIACDALAALAEGVAGAVLEEQAFTNSAAGESQDSLHFRILALADQLDSDGSDLDRVGRFSTPPRDSMSPKNWRLRQSSNNCARKNSLLEEINRLSSIRSSSVADFARDDRTIQYPVPQGITSLPAGVTPLSQVQQIQLRITGSVGKLSPVQAAQLQVAKLNSGTLSAPTTDDAIRWKTPPDKNSKSGRLAAWQVGVLKAKRRARRAGYTDATEVLQVSSSTTGSISNNVFNIEWGGALQAVYYDEPKEYASGE
ncbi:hypothetical protein C8R43DRAFT_1128267 [Mycena crocata]|nr:hypothetical protein C8R43DRAFT_1128267 [Mycena crocata]